MIAANVEEDKKFLRMKPSSGKSWVPCGA